MLNMMRSDLFRLGRNGTAAALAIAGFLLFTVAAYARLYDGVGYVVAPGAVTMLDLTGAAGFGSVLLLPYLAAAPGALLVIDDYTAGALKTLLAPGRRGAYLASKAVLGVAATIASCTLLAVSCQVAAWAAGIPLGPVPDGAAVAWWGLAAVTGLCYAWLTLLAMLLVRQASVGWLLFFMVGMGLAGKVVLGALAIVGGAGAMQATTALPLISAYALGEGSALVVDAGAALRLGFVPLFWAVAAMIAAYARMRRKPLA